DLLAALDDPAHSFEGGGADRCRDLGHGALIIFPRRLAVQQRLRRAPLQRVAVRMDELVLLLDPDRERRPLHAHLSSTCAVEKGKKRTNQRRWRRAASPGCRIPALKPSNSAVSGAGIAVSREARASSAARSTSSVTRASIASRTSRDRK